MTSKKEKAQRRENALTSLNNILGAEFAVSAVADYGEELVTRIEERLVPLPYGPDRQAISAKLKQEGLDSEWLESESGLHLRLKFPDAKPFPRTNLILFLLTLVTVFFVPQCIHVAETTFLSGKEPLDPLVWLSTPAAWDISWALQFTGWLMAILLAHEFGHYFAGKRRNLRVSLPYFIPFPTLIGTMGAVIKFKSPIENRRDLIEVGAAGPVAGFVVAFIAAWVGMYQSVQIDIPEHYGTLGDPLVLKFLGNVIYGASYYDAVILPSASMYAGWVGFLITALNMLPISQLDGGHITYGLFGSKQRIVALITLGGLVIAGTYWSGWWVYAAFALFFRPFHPPTLDDSAPLPLSAKILGWTALIIFALTFSLAPFGIQ